MNVIFKGKLDSRSLIGKDEPDNDEIQLLNT